VKADFSGQRWFVTGASGGIGREIVAQALSRGAEVMEKLEGWRLS
jgi:NAD(P)-dependent dehydrogenase (short-subunit alcohol dehydrogenase family)